jgi:hypothetical protein
MRDESTDKKYSLESSVRNEELEEIVTMARMLAQYEIDTSTNEKLVKSCIKLRDRIDFILYDFPIPENTEVH